MKTKLFFLACILAVTISGVKAQGNQRKSVEDRVAIVHEKFEKAFSLDKSKLDEIDNLFTEFYTSQQKIRENIQGSSLAQGLVQQDFQSVRKRNEDLINDREGRLKKLLTADQYKKWKDDIEPSLRNSRQK